MSVTPSTTTSIPAERGNPYPVVPDRLIRIDGIDFVRCPMHGLIPLEHECSKSPGDHWCRAAAHPTYDPAEGPEGLDDQACSHREWGDTQSAKLHYISDLHVQGEADGHGGMSGFCVECEWAWPCRTGHMARGWGDISECEEQGWCAHEGVPINRG